VSSLGVGEDDMGLRVVESVETSDDGLREGARGPYAIFAAAIEKDRTLDALDGDDGVRVVGGVDGVELMGVREGPAVRVHAGPSHPG
jgi:hypothetical protein